jgi:hypothetical protein
MDKVSVTIWVTNQVKLGVDSVTGVLSVLNGVSRFWATVVPNC